MGRINFLALSLSLTPPPLTPQKINTCKQKNVKEKHFNRRIRTIDLGISAKDITVTATAQTINRKTKK